VPVMAGPPPTAAEIAREELEEDGEGGVLL
jgi:hypothetical protein